MSVALPVSSAASMTTAFSRQRDGKSHGQAAEHQRDGGSAKQRWQVRLQRPAGPRLPTSYSRLPDITRRGCAQHAGIKPRLILVPDIPLPEDPFQRAIAHGIA